MALMGCSYLFAIICFSWTFLILGTHQLQSSQTQVLLQLRKHLEYPTQLEIWSNTSSDFCYLSSAQVNITCKDNFVTGLKIVGDKPKVVRDFDGIPIPNQTLSGNFSMDSFVATLARLTSLRTLSLVLLGIWGPLPNKFHRLYSLEHLDLSLNFLYGAIPPSISRMVNLQNLTLDGNFFNGTFPDQFDSLSNLTYLSLRKNHLSGSLPSSIQRINTLTDLILSENELSGKLPDLSGLSILQVMDFSENKLNCELPSIPRSLVMAFLSKNSFFGEIPLEYSQLHQLQHLDLSFNSLQGTLPAAIFSLSKLTYISLGSNMLSGALPVDLSCGNALRLVDISNNRFRGSLPSCLSTAIDKRFVKYGGNCLLMDIRHQHPESYCVEVHRKKKESRSGNVGILIGFIGAIAVVVVLLAFGFVVLCRIYCPRGTSEQHLLRKSVQENSITAFNSELLANARLVTEASKLRTKAIPVYQLFSYEELNLAANSFDNSTIMGEGSFGKLYRGRLENGTQIAIRSLTVSKKYTIRNLKLRLDLLAKFQHPHLVCLMGHCICNKGQDEFGTSKVFLVYEYMAHGSYRSYLSEKSPEKVLRWSDRLAILIGVAKAVHFLHTGIIPGFYNNRLKANNILLNEHRMAKLSDYGLSIVAQERDTHEEKGSNLKSWQMKSLEDDVYSFGFILLESLVGPSVAARKEAFLLNEMVYLGSPDGWRRSLDPTVVTTSTKESVSIAISIMNKCISPDSSRPSFEDVLWNLQYAAQVQASADGDQRFEMVPLS